MSFADAIAMRPTVSVDGEIRWFSIAVAWLLSAASSASIIIIVASGGQDGVGCREGGHARCEGGDIGGESGVVLN